MSLRNAFASYLKKLPGVRRIVAESDRLRCELSALTKNPLYVPSGHFYSPIPSLEEIQRDEARIFGPFPREIPGVDLREDAQLKLLESFVPFYGQMPFQDRKTEGLRYYFENPAYSYADAILLYCMIRHLRPARVVEIGSGFSSCVTLDTNERFLDNRLLATFIEPYPELLRSLLKESDRDTVRIIPSRLQDTDLAEFERLAANDILFVDSTHVSKVNSDVNRLFFEVLPRLASGVHVHFHDIHYPFEYPRPWVLENRAWNESYVLRAFLQYNSAFEVVLMNTYMEWIHEPFFEKHMPLCLKNRGGSLWIRRA